MLLGVAFVALAVATTGRRERAARVEAALEAAVRNGGLGWTVDLATAPRDELALLPGVGPVWAAAFDKARAAGFEAAFPEDLQAIPGAGPKTVARLRPHLFFDSATRARGRSRAEAATPVERPGRAPPAPGVPP